MPSFVIGEYLREFAMAIAMLTMNEVGGDSSESRGGATDGASDGKILNTCPMYARIRWLLVESRGGPVRSKILLMLKQRPTNINRLAKELDMDYKAVKRHLDLLEKNGLVRRLGIKYGDVYFIDDNAYRHWDELYSLIKESLKLDRDFSPQG